MQDSDTLGHAVFNQHLHYDSNSKPAMQRRWSGDNLRRKLIAQKHLQHCAIHPFQLSKLPFRHILCLHCANKELSVQAVSNVLKLRLLLPRIWKKFLPTIPAHRFAFKETSQALVFFLMFLTPMWFPKWKLKRLKHTNIWYEIFIKVRITWSGCLLCFNWVIDLLEILSFRNMGKQYIASLSRYVKITMLRLVLPDLTRRLFQSLANRKQKQLHGSEWPREISAKWLKWLELIFWSNYGHLEAPLNAGSRARVKISFHLCGPTLRVYQINVYQLRRYQKTRLKALQ